MASIDRPVSALMQREVATVQQGEGLDLADDIMRLGHVRHLPVLDGEKLVGVVSNRDLLAASLSKALEFEPNHRRAFMRSVEVKEVMGGAVETASPEEPVVDAARRMLRKKIGCLPVVDENGVLVGLLSETDVLRAAVSEADAELVVAGEGTVYDEEFEELRRMRDELRVQLELGKAEARDLWEKLETRFHEAEAQVRALARRAEEPLEDVAEAAQLLIDEVRSGYRRLRQLL